MGNTDIWDALKQPPPSALKTIGGGRLKNMTDIKPQWRYLAMTQLFGPCGIGWKYTIDRFWTELGANGEVLAFAQVQLYYKDKDGKWSDPVPGIGGSTLIDRESAGLHSSDEGFKMATTDALSVAMKMIGVGADVYMGSWTGSKYKDDAYTSSLPPEDAGLDDPRDSRGRLSPARDPGPIKPKRDGTRGALMEWQKKLNGLYATNYPDGSPVLSLDEKKDMVAEGRPGGRELQPTDADLELARDVYEKYRAIIDHRLDIYHNGDSAKE